MMKMTKALAAKCARRRRSPEWRTLSSTATTTPAVCSLSSLLGHLSLERLEEDLFRGNSIDPGWGRVFGGQVLAQALSAAQATAAPGRHAHSLHSYFLRPGDVTRPIIYDVERIRDGASFSARRVKAVQNGKPIFFMTASFHVPEDLQYEHQDVEDLSNIPDPELCRPVWDHMSDYTHLVPDAARLQFEATFGPESPIELRPAMVFQSPTEPKKREPVNALWIRAKDGKLPLTTDETEGTVESNVHRSLLSYASDYGLLETALQPHAVSLWGRKMQVATVDHSMWFHHDFRIDDWLLHRIHSPAASNGRGFCTGEVLDRRGRLVANTSQQGLMRKLKKKKLFI
jgi:acyl-CoA thioesterase-2